MNLHLPEKQKVILLEDIEIIGSQSVEFFDGSFYADTTELILRTKTPSWENYNNHILEDLVKQVKAEKYGFSSENPLRISGLEQIKDENQDNYYGLLLKIGKDTKIINDKRFAYNQNEIQLGDPTTPYTKESGLSGVLLDLDCIVVCTGDLAESYDGGRVVIGASESVTPQYFETRLKALETEKEKQISQINEKYTKAREMLERYTKTMKILKGESQ